MSGNIIDVGQGPTVVMAHGTMMDHTMFAPQIAALKNHYRMIAFDQRARGPSYDQRYSLGDLATDCHDLLESLSIESCVLVGMSMGGFMVTEFMRRWPERLDALVLIGSQIGVYDKAEQAVRMREFQKFDRDGTVSPQLAEETASYIFGQATQRENPALIEHWVDRWSGFPARSVLREAQSWLGKPGYAEVARKFDKPVLVIHGEDDPVLPVAEKTAEMIDAFPDIEVTTVPEAGHVVNLEQPDITNAALLQFLERLPLEC